MHSVCMEYVEALVVRMALHIHQRKEPHEKNNFPQKELSGTSITTHNFYKTAQKNSDQIVTLNKLSWVKIKFI